MPDTFTFEEASTPQTFSYEDAKAPESFSFEEAHDLEELPPQAKPLPVVSLPAGMTEEPMLFGMPVGGRPSVQLPKYEGQPLFPGQKPSTTLEVGGGLYNALAGAAESLTTPESAMTLGMAGAPKAIGRLAAGVWAAFMAKNVPEQVQEARKAFKEGKPLSDKVEKALAPLITSALVGTGAREALKPEPLLTGKQIETAQEQARLAGLPSQEPLTEAPKAPETPPVVPEPIPTAETAPTAPQQAPTGGPELRYHDAHGQEGAILESGKISPRSGFSVGRPFTEPKNDSLLFTYAEAVSPRQRTSEFGTTTDEYAVRPIDLSDPKADVLFRERETGRTVSVKDAYSAGEKSPEALISIGRKRLSPPIPEQPVKAAEARKPELTQREQDKLDDAFHDAEITANEILERDPAYQREQQRVTAFEEEIADMEKIAADRNNPDRRSAASRVNELEVDLEAIQKGIARMRERTLASERQKAFDATIAKIAPEEAAPPAPVAPTPEPAISFPGIGSLREKQSTAMELGKIRKAEPELWKAITQMFGTDQPAKIARLAKIRFEEKSRSIGPGAASTEEFGPSESAMGNVPAAQAIRQKSIRIVEGIKQLWQRRANKEQITAQNEAADNNARITGRQAGSSIRIGTDKIQRRAITFVMQSLKMAREGQPFAGDPAAYLRDGISRIRATNKEATEAATYALYHYDELLPEAQRAHAKLDAQIDRERSAGLDTEYEAWYVPQRHELDLLPGPDRPVILGQSRGTGGTGFRKAKTFPDYFTAIEAGFVPKTLDIADLVEHRVSTGERIVMRKRWADQFRNVTDPVDEKPVVTDIERRVINRPDGTVDVQYAAPLGYSLYEPVPGTRIAVHDGYKRLFNALTARSQIAESAIGSAALSATASLKSGLLLLDTFHVSRVGQSQAALTFKLGYKKGLSLLEYADADLNRAVEAGLITPEMADYARNNRPVAQLLVNQGLNVGRIHQQMYTDWLKYLPPIEATNKWIFEKMTRGAMLESAMIEFNRISRNHPEWPQERVARQVAKDINAFYSNLGKQGLIKNPTLRDLLQITMLAPWWVEGLATREAKAIFQSAGAIKELATTGNLNVPTVAKGVMTGIAAYVVATQMVNLFTRGHLTFQNGEEGHKLDAWIPDVTGKTKGYFISPLSVFGEITHDFLRYGESKPTFADAAAQIGYNKLSPVGRSAAIALTGRDVFGRKLPTTASRALEAGGALLPVPIPLAGFTSQRPGSVQRQLTSGVGLKTEYAPTDAQQLSSLHKKWMASNPDPKVRADYERAQTETFGESKYKGVLTALANKDADALKRAVSELQAKGTKVSDIKKRLAPRTAEGSRKLLFHESRKLETQFRNSLTPEQRQLYNAALREREEQWRFFRRYF